MAKRELLIKVDLKNKEYQEIILKQFDTTTINFEILEENQKFELTGLSANLIFVKPNNKVVIQSAIVNTERKLVIANLKEDCVRIYGKGTIEVELKKDEEIISTFQIITNIEKSGKGNINSEDEKSFIENINEAIESINELKNEMISSETSRVEAENSRETNEEERQLAESNRKEEEENRNVAENLRISSEEKRDIAEKERVSNENVRKSNEENRQLFENSRLESEENRVSNEENRKKAEENRISEEEKRVKAESNRSTAEEERNTSENLRNTTEIERVNAENERKQTEIQRIEAEDLRSTNESEREKNEEERKTNEEERKISETIRENNEENRKEAEIARETYITELKERVDRGDFKGESNVLTIGEVTKGEDASAEIIGDSPNQKLNLVLPKGDTGNIGLTGNGIKSIELKEGSTHESGTFDIYIITYTDETTKEIQIYNGKDGEGSGDMLKSKYDTDNDGIVDNAKHSEISDNATNAEKVNNYTVEKNVPKDAVFTDTIYDDTEIKSSIKEVENLAIEVKTQLENKVDKEDGKSLSENNYTTEEKNKLANLKNYDDTDIKNNLDNKVDKIEGKNLSTNDFSDENKEKLDLLEEPLTKKITLLSDNWQQNNEEWEYDVKDVAITENHRVDLLMDNKNQIKFSGNVHTNSYNGGFKIITDGNKPEENIEGDLSIIKHKGEN